VTTYTSCFTHVRSFVTQVFRTYREAFESQKLTIEQRFRGLLEEAIQDAIFLATKNAELVDENRRLNEGTVRYFIKISLHAKMSYRYCCHERCFVKNWFFISTIDFCTAIKMYILMRIVIFI